MPTPALSLALALAAAGVAALLAACGPEDAAPPPPLVATPLAAAPAPAPTAVAPPSPAPVAPPPDPTAAAAAAYRAWMEEARLLHPYPEPLEKMWAVMLCESSGDAAVVGAGVYHGLFQYSLETWGGAWNPYRDQPIFDPRAQIFATAAAWQAGHQAWWGCY